MIYFKVTNPDIHHKHYFGKVGLFHNRNLAGEVALTIDGKWVYFYPFELTQVEHYPSPEEIYRQPQYKFIADQVENLQLKTGYLMQDLNKTYPPQPNQEWLIKDNRPAIGFRQPG